MRVKFQMSSGESFIVSEEEAKRILSADKKLVLVKDRNGEWSGNTINKAHLVCTSQVSEKIGLPPEVKNNKLKDKNNNN